jgi:hypothetical protein
VKIITFKYVAEFPDDVTPAQIDEIALAAAVQIEDPEGAPSPLYIETSVHVDDASVTLDYDEACRRAAFRQGLNPVIRALTEAEIAFVVEQTGGFTMVVTVATPDGTYGITNDGGYLLGFYPDLTWQRCERDDATYTYDMDLADLVEQIRQALSDV